MTSSATSGRQQTCSFCILHDVLAGILDNVSTDFETVYIFWNGYSSAYFTVLYAVGYVCFLTQKTGLRLTFGRLTYYINCCFRSVVAFKSHLHSVLGLSGSKYYRQQSLWDECQCVLHSSTNRWAFLLVMFMTRILNNGSTNCERVYSFEKDDSSASFLPLNEAVAS